jgi:two-component system, cell cycle sensor histidine kinase and response regulator CckA
MPPRSSILLLEQDTGVRHRLLSELERAGYGVVPCSSIEEAEGVLRSDSPVDLLLAAVDPGSRDDGTGGDTAIFTSRDIPVLLLVADGDDEHLAEGAETVSYGFVLKDAAPSFLNASIKAALRLHKTVRETEQKTQSLIDAVGESVALFAPDGKFLTANRTALSRMGTTIDQVRLKKGFPGADHSLVEARRLIIADVVRTGKPVHYGDERDGISFEHDLYPVRNSGGTITAVAAFGRDVTVQKRDRQVLHEAEEKYRVLFSGMPYGAALHEIITDTNGTPVDYTTLEVNGAFLTLLGIERGDVIGRKASDILPPDEFQRWLEVFGPVALGDEPRHYEIYSSFTNRHYDGKAYCQDEGRFAVIFSDVTDRKRIEDDLRTTRLHLADAADLAKIAYFEFDAASGNFVFNDGFYELLGTTAEREGGYLMPPKEYEKRFVHPDDVEELNRSVTENLHDPAGGYFSQYEHRAVRGDGGVIHIVSRNRTVKDDTGALVKIAGVNQDITERKKTEEQLMVARLGLESSISAMSFADLDGVVTYANSAFLRLWGYETPEEVLGRHISKFMMGAMDGACVSAILSGRSYIGEDIARRQDGSSFPVQAGVNVVRTNQGKPLFLMGSFTDISKRKKIEEQLMEAERRYRELVQFAPAGIYEIDFQTHHFTSVNEEACRISGYSRDEFLALDPMDILDEDSGVRFQQRITGWLNGEEGDRNVEYRVKVKDGRLIDVILNVTFTKNKQGVPVGARVAGVDITERKAAERALVRNEQLFRSLVETSSDWIWETNKDGVYTYASPRVAELLGYTPEEMVGQIPFAIMPPDEAVRVGALFQKIADGRESFSALRNVNIHKDGRRVVIETNGTPIFGPDGEYVGYRGFDRDVTKEEQYKATLQQAEEKYRRLFSELSHGAALHRVITDESENVVDYMTLEVNRAYEELLGCKEGDIAGVKASDILPPEELKHWLGVFGPVAVTGRSVSYEMFSPLNGKYFHGTAYSPAKGQFAVVFTDVTERKAAEEALKRYELLSGSSRDIIVFMAKDGRILEANGAAERAYGYRHDELVELKISDLRAEETRSTVKRQLAEADEKGILFETLHVRKDGTTFPVEISARGATIGGIRTLISVVRDITDRKKLEEQLRQAQKMEAIGTLAGGVAHDFNNILTVIMGLGNVIQMNMGRDDVNKPFIDQIVLSSERAAELTRSLLAFSRKQRISLEPNRVDETISGAAKLLKRLLTEDIVLSVELHSNNTSAMLDVAQIDQVLMNLATNARDAMPGGGSLTITTDVAAIDQTFKRIHGFGTVGSYVRISIADTGIGMDEKTIERIFDPFFTTKELGKGTGLGLASVYGIVKQHGGYITVRSELLQGTTFDIYLPVIDILIRESSVSPPKPQGGSETILIIEDDKDVRKMIKSVLSSRGYATLEATGGNDAIAVFSQHRKDIGLLLIDVVMPGKNGREVLDDIARMDPRVKAIFMSGYTGDIIIDKGVQKEDVEFLQKPLSVAKLLEKVREVLDR